MQHLVPSLDQAPVNNEGPTVVKLWRGIQVNGRLLWPDQTPAAGVRLTTGVYIYNQSWKEKLGIDLTWYSFDHGDWPHWSRMIITDEAGRFSVAVPPKDARLWVRIGTTQLGFSPQTGFGETEAVTTRLAKCAPLEIQYGGHNVTARLASQSTRYGEAIKPRITARNIDAPLESRIAQQTNITADRSEATRRTRPAIGRAEGRCPATSCGVASFGGS